MIHAIATVLSGVAIALTLLGLTRPAVVILAIATCLQIWSLETLRTATVHRENLG